MYDVVVKTLGGQTYRYEDCVNYYFDDSSLWLDFSDGGFEVFDRWDPDDIPYLSSRIADHYIDKVSIREVQL